MERVSCDFFASKKVEIMLVSYTSVVESRERIGDRFNLKFLPFHTLSIKEMYVLDHFLVHPSE